MLFTVNFFTIFTKIRRNYVETYTTHTTPHDQMADEANMQLESALNTLLSKIEKSGKSRKDLKRDIVDSVSTLRNIFVNLNNSVKEQMAKIGYLKARLRLRRRSFRDTEPLIYQHTTRNLGTGQGKLQRQA
jgi:predicted  nucleic acid-binding Zn-ribbon protein